MEITRCNFGGEIAEIVQSIHASSFIAIDTEFTGLHATQEDINSLFDTPQLRYDKLRRMAKQYTVCQLGISSFVKVPNENAYKAHTYNFYLFPRSVSSLDARFTCQASSIEFLCKYQFDFNKLFYKGLSYLTNDQEHELRKQAETEPVQLARYLDEDLQKDACKLVSDWLTESQPGDEVYVGQYEELEGLQLQLVLQQSCPIVNTCLDPETGQLRVRRMSEENAKDLHSDQVKLGNRIVDLLLGFTKVFRAIVESKKPIVGHNLVTDMLLLYEKFHKPLPDKYVEFKTELHKLFPVVYDTKHITNRLKKNLIEAGLQLSNTALPHLLELLSSEKGRTLILYSPNIMHADRCTKYVTTESFHEAGYDAYATGYVFLRLAHYITLKDIAPMARKALDFREYTFKLKDYENKLNLIRAMVNDVNLAGPDPPSRRPQWLHVTSRSLTKSLDVGQLAQEFGAYSSVDVQAVDRRRALLAVATYGGSKDILRAYKNHKALSVVKYNAFQHSRPVRIGLWSALALTGAFCVWAFLGDQSKSSR